MNIPRKRTELLLAAAALLLAAGVLLAAGARSALASPEPIQPQTAMVRANPFEASQPAPNTAPVEGTESPAEGDQVNGSYAADGMYAVGYTGIVVYPPVEAPLQPYDDETAPPPPQAYEAQPPPAAPPIQTPTPSQAQQPMYPVNLNTATQAQLEALPGIGPVKAQAILAWRAANGGFANANQLLQVTGIGQKTFEGLLPYITW